MNDAFYQQDEEFPKLKRLGELEGQLQTERRQGLTTQERTTRRKMIRLFSTRGRVDF